MDKYHIYEEIGKGEFSQVFKGREKKKIEYVAIKRVEKSMMSKVVNEVQIMHKLESPHILKFHDWYETRNNLWLILEYCTGADLESLLKQDGHLPEASVRMFGLDMVAALKYMHNLGILHCDLRPKNFLVDEYGILKISDFKSARKLPKVPSVDSLKSSKDSTELKGTAAYMSPELFTLEGIHSYCSDFWAVGCVLYELRRGVPPFGWEYSGSSGSVSTKDLVDRINTAEPVGTPIVFSDHTENHSNTNTNYSNSHGSNRDKESKGDRSYSSRGSSSSSSGSSSTPSVTPEFADLLQWLLEKSPSDRCLWPELVSHPFWGDTADRNEAPSNLPSQPAFEAYIKNLQRSKSRAVEAESMANYGFIYDELTGAYVCSEESKAKSAGDNHGESLPIEAVFQPRESKLPGPERDRDRDRGSNLGAGDAHGHPHLESSVRSESKNGREEVGRDKDSNNDSKMWLSSSARAKDSPIASRRRDESGDLRQLEESATPSKVQVPSSHYNKGKVVAAPSKIPVASGHTPHAAVNPSEAKTPLSRHAGYSSSGNGGPSGLPVCVPPSPPAQTILQAPLIISENNSNSSSRGKSANHAKGASIAQTPLSPGPLPSNMNKQQRGYSEYLNDDADSNPNSINKQKQLDSKASRFPVDNTPSAQSFLGSYRVHEAVWAKGLQLSVEGLLTHASDSQVRPIVGNKSIEAIEKAVFKPAALPFPALSTEDIGRLSQTELESHLTQVYKALHRHVVLSSPPTATAVASSATMSALNDRLNVLGYLCSNAHSAEVANIVLNTHFLSLLLRLLRGPAGAVIPSAGGPQMSSSAYWTLLGACRGLAATVLATTLRYTTFVQPPTAKNRDDHILPTLISILRDNTKVEVKLRRRCVAALGELVFYITAQEEETHTTSGTAESRWALPQGAITVLTRCLKDDSDEAVRHYAAKTFENVLAQGGLEYRKRLVSQEAAIRLLFIAQSSTRNESIQASCGMALAHMVHLVVTTNPYIPTAIASTFASPIDSAPSPEPGSGSATPSSRRLAGSGPLARVNATKGGTIRMEVLSGRESPSKTLAGSLIGSPAGLGLTQIVDDGTDEAVTPGAWAHFIVNVFDQEGALSGILDALKDGPPKLQQAYLNIVNMIFLESNTSPRAEDTDVDGVLLCVRKVLVKADGALSSILRLIDQGGSSAVRAKALFAAQLLCRHSPSLLRVLGERRLPHTLVRLIEPFVSRTADSDGPGGKPDDPKGPKSPDPLSYVEKAALSMVMFLRAACVGGASELRHQLDLISPRSATALGGGTPSPSRPSEREGAFTGASKGQNTPSVLQGAQTPSSGQRTQISPYNGRNLDGEFESGRRKEDGDITGYDRRRPEDRGKGDRARAEDGSATLNIARLSSASVALRAAVGMASQPSLRRLMIAGADDDSDGRGRGDSDFISILSGILSVLPSARATATLPSSSSHLLDAVIEAEQAVLVALEIIAQIDAQVDFGLRSNGARSFLETVARKLLPAVSSLSVHADADVRVVVSASLRRMVPTVLRDLGREEADLCLSAFLVHIPSLMGDHAPIPQYTIRLLCEAIKASPHAIHVVTTRLLNGGHLKTFITALAGTKSVKSEGDRFQDDEAVSGCDPQLPILLRTLYEKGQQEDQEQAMHLKKNPIPAQPESPTKKKSSTRITYAMLELGIAQSLCIAIQSSVGDASSATSITAEVVTSLVQLLHRVLLFVIMSLSQSVHTAPSSNSAGQGQAVGEADQLRRYVMPLRDLCPSLFTVLAGAVTVHTGITFDRKEEDEGEYSPTDMSSSRQLYDSTARCLGILFDIFPDVIISHLVSSKALEGTQGEDPQNSPRGILSRLLVCNQVDLKIRIRLLKIIMGVCKIAPAMGPSMVQRAKDLLLSPPLHKALMTCINPPAGGSFGSNGGAVINPTSDRPSSADVALYVDLARELLANAIQM